MTHKLKNIIVLGCIVLIAVFLRVWDLGNTPPSPDWDETARVQCILNTKDWAR